MGLGLLVVLVAVAATAVWQRERIRALADNWHVLRDGAEQAPAAQSSEALVEWIRAHPDKVLLATWTPGRESEAVLHRADEPTGIASTVKALVLAEYARQAAEGRLDPNERVTLAQWEAFYLPGTDGRAHPRALEALRESGGLEGDEATLAEVARAMIVHSDNAATDLLLHRLGREAVSSTAAWLGLNEPAPVPLAGTMLLARTPPEGTLPARWMEELAQKGPEHAADEAWRIQRRLAEDPAFAQAQREGVERDGIGLNLPEQVQYAQTLGPRGTARGYAALMAKVLTAPEGDAWAKHMAEALEWPMTRPAVNGRFERFGTKGGSLPGVLTAAYFAEPKGGEPRVLALFFRDVPFALWAQLLRRYTQQDVERRLLEEPEFARTLFAPAAGTAGAAPAP